MDEHVAVKSLNFGTLFKIVFWSGVCAWTLLSCLAALFAFLAPSMITVNGAQAKSTAEALLIVPILLVFGIVATSIFTVLGAGLLRLLGRFLPLGNIQASD